MIHIASRMAWDFIIRMLCNLKRVNCLFLEFSFNIFGPWNWNHRGQNFGWRSTTVLKKQSWFGDETEGRLTHRSNTGEAEPHSLPIQSPCYTLSSGSVWMVRPKVEKREDLLFGLIPSVTKYLSGTCYVPGTGHKPVDKCIVRSTILRAALTSLGLTDPQRPNHESPYSHQMCPRSVGKAPHSARPLPPVRPAALHPILNWIGFSLLTCEIIQISQSYPLMGKQGSVTSPWGHYKACCSQLLLVHFVSECNAVWSCLVCGVLSSGCG